jgi:hypothetical protein
VRKHRCAFREYRRKRHKKKRAQAEVKLAQSQQGRFDVLKAELTKKLQLELEQSLLVGVRTVPVWQGRTQLSATKIEFPRTTERHRACCYCN